MNVSRCFRLLAPAALLLNTCNAGVEAALQPEPARPNVLLPAERVIDWRNSGIPGGVPNRTQACANIPADASASAIQSALDACPPSQVVRLAAGVYELNQGLTIPSNVVLRGAGPRETILKASGRGNGFIRFGKSGSPSAVKSTAITAGASRGSTRLTLSASEGIGVGSYLMVTQLNDPAYVTVTTSNGSCTWCDGGIGWNGTRVQGQIVEVASADGKTIGITPGLFIDYDRSPLATPVAMGAVGAGVEDLQVAMNNSGYTANFLMEGTAYCWIRNVESSYTDGDHAQLHWGYRNEIRDSYFHDAFKHSPGSTDADIFVANKTSGTLIENNVLRRLHQSVMLNWGAAGNVVGYNYVDGNFDSAGTNTLFGGLSVHGAHPMFNLWEGNVAPKLDADFFWGSSSHNTAFRNWFKGAAMVAPPLTGRDAEKPADAFWVSQALAAVDLSQTARYYNLLGNVIGSNWQKSLGKWTPMVVAPQPRSYYTTNNPYGYSLGYASLSDTGTDRGDSDLVMRTTVIHGDYDLVAGAFRWDKTLSGRDLPESLYLPTKPRWFGSLGWPAFGPKPNSPTAALIGEIPAKVCFDRGKMPTCLAH